MKKSTVRLIAFIMVLTFFITSVGVMTASIFLGR
ncbi:hypothetical protein M972_111140 [Acetivibrio thermocellus AD2]|jgi:hypothetical protein|uniref:Uncharacterized protein n=2 Tax=Acetivibrio thermocellus TaxID=1515 RepID=G2JC91_ACET2|nr:hypothetical protein Clo1313_1092 [Acetivibrio thermocellus DSM 1313]AEO12413.1 hypothetical protein Cthe_3344 [Acetivibrio thermocellus ATCC 27405]ALX08098.1 hypothetical protein AD2_01103 [Acetivibrio thermocellus AD2]ANV75845.1 hypothetical protein LQRI_1104 [Acetivibrio thermocellus DSM 2360]EIC06031.1 hypothetical protein YSBL_0423 [Acetivibrio thermocellus YS]CDG35843.1 putative membrane protein [Acetivibrio thermocellus BC1]SOD25951.1 hypothetical protein SAMN04515622_2450 [Acetivib